MPLSSPLDVLRERVLLCGGGVGARVQAINVDLERDFLGKENWTEVLLLSRPDIVRDIHRFYFVAGADIVEPNTFGASPIVLGKFGLDAEAFALNKSASGFAREAAEEFADGRDRWVLGSIGPGPQLRTLGSVDYDTLEAALTVQADGLIAGGVGSILIET